MPEKTPRRSDEPRFPPPEGSTYHTAHRSQTGTEHEPPAIDLREKGEDAD